MPPVLCGLVALLFVALACGCARDEGAGQQTPRSIAPRWSVRMADSTIARYPNPALMEDPQPQWRYSSSFLVHAIGRLGVETGNKKYIDYAQLYADAFIANDGRIDTPTYAPKKYRLDDVLPGRVLLLLHEQTRD